MFGQKIDFSRRLNKKKTVFVCNLKLVLAFSCSSSINGTYIYGKPNELKNILASVRYATNICVNYYLHVLIM